jgi:hypothetical protein
MDSLRKILYHDDAQICRKRTSKDYVAAGEPVGVEIEVWRV